MGARRIVRTIKIIFVIISMGRSEKKRFLLFLFSSDISLAKAIGRPNWERLIRREKVGIINI